MSALPCQIEQAAKFPEQTVCPNNPTGTARPWRAWLKTDFCSLNWEFATRAEAVAYLAAQVARADGVDTRRAAYGMGRDRIQYRGTFLQHGLEVYSLGDLRLVPLYTVPMAPRTAERVIDDAHRAICRAELALFNAATDADKARHGAELIDAQGYLSRAIATRDAWDAAGQTDECIYPYVPKTCAELARRDAERTRTMVDQSERDRRRIAKLLGRN